MLEKRKLWMDCTGNPRMKVCETEMCRGAAARSDLTLLSFLVVLFFFFFLITIRISNLSIRVVQWCLHCTAFHIPNSLPLTRLLF